MTAKHSAGILTIKWNCEMKYVLALIHLHKKPVVIWLNAS